MNAEQFAKETRELNGPSKVTRMVEVLRGPQGCPWDQKQTAKTMVNYIIDEAHELKAALDASDEEEAVSELGDLLFTVEFLSQTLGGMRVKEEASSRLVDKMIRRHPHVFASSEFADESQIKRNWEMEKQRENEARTRYDADIPPSLPPLARAWKVVTRLQNAGFCYASSEDAWDKVCEEFEEAQEALLGAEGSVEEELGDLLLSLVSFAKVAQISLSDALLASVGKLGDRIENLEAKAGLKLPDIPREELPQRYSDARGRDSEAYFNYCGVSLWPREVRQAVRRSAHGIGRSGLAAVLELREQREGLRTELLNFVEASKGTTCTFVPNVTAAALGVAFSLPWEKASTILLGEGEFPANTIPWKSAARTFGGRVEWFDEDLFRREPDRALEELERALTTKSVDILALSAVSFWSGYRLPLELIGSICKRLGVRFFVDGIQALGTVPVRMSEGVTFLAGGSHKALSCPEGAGFLLVSAEAARDWTPRLNSWLSLPEPVDFLTSGKWEAFDKQAQARPRDPSTLESGSLNTLGYAALAASIELHSELEPSRIFDRIEQLQNPLETALVDLGFESLRATSKPGRSAVLSCRPPVDVDLLELQEHLRLAKVSVGIPRGCLRFGFHHFNTEKQVEHAISSLLAFPRTQ